MQELLAKTKCRQKAKKNIMLVKEKHILQNLYSDYTLYKMYIICTITRKESEIYTAYSVGVTKKLCNLGETI